MRISCASVVTWSSQMPNMCVCDRESGVCVRGGERCLLDLLPHSVIFSFVV